MKYNGIEIEFGPTSWPMRLFGVFVFVTFPFWWIAIMRLSRNGGKGALWAFKETAAEGLEIIVTGRLDGDN